MTEILPLLLAFMCGIVFNVFWGYTLGLGYGLMTFKTSMIDSLVLLAKNIQSTYEIQQLKYMSYEMLDRDEKYIEFQKTIDQNELRSMKNTMIRNYVNSIPARYNHLVQFHDWDSAMDFINTAIKERQ